MKRGVVRALGWAAAIDYLAFQLPYFVRERRTIEALAEQHVPIVTSAR